MESELSDKIRECMKKFGFNFDLKKEQLEIINLVLDGENCIGLLPTGFGKSVCFTIPTLIRHEENDGVSLVVSPLKGLMKDQCDSLLEHGIDSIVLNQNLSPETVQAIKDGKFPFLFTSPENLSSQFYRRIIPELRFNLLVCDEAHCISEWGEDFRPEFRNFDCVRSFLLDCPVLALTATATQKIVDDIHRYLLLPHDTKLVAVVPDRENIFLDVRKSKQDLQEMRWIVSHIREEKTNSKKIIVYCSALDSVFYRTYNSAFAVFSFFMEELGSESYVGDEVNVHNRVVELFTGSTDEKTQNRIINTFRNTDSTIRVLVATVAFGMGIQIPDVSVVVNWGAPKSVMSFWQEIGRCARNKTPGYSVTYAYPRSLTPVSADKAMIEMIKSTNCLRLYSLDFFVVKGMNVERLEKIRNKSECNGSCVDVCVCELFLCCSCCMHKCSCPSKMSDPLAMFI